VGQPLPCDAYDGRGTLLLREGHVITSSRQIEKLMQHALMADALPGDAARAIAGTSPLAFVLSARQRLHALFVASSPADFPTEVLHVAGMVRRACKLNADVALASILMRREGPYTIRHAVNAAIACQITGTAMKLAPAELLATVAAALTMNIGMFELQQELQALDGPLTEAQQAAVRSHCERSAAMLRGHRVTDALWLEIVQDHHERPDGSGYPAGKTGDAIGLPTQLLSLADVYCARVSCRDSRPAMLPNVALRWLFLNEGTAVNGHLAALFIKTLGVYPPGTGVRLRNGSIAVVIRRGATGHMPRVASITTHDGLRIGVPIRRRGDESAHAVSGVVDLDDLQLAVGMEALWGSDGAA
jgi:HD-GYP domain-containing protein (c-di-GMP phosphodiesterase class II)